MLLLYGGMAGVLSWLVPYPIDTVKTTIQLSTSKQTLKIRDVIRNKYKAHGIRYFY